MKLTATPFDATTGELLPVYRDAYLRGDLSGKNTELVDSYLQANPAKVGATADTWNKAFGVTTNFASVTPLGNDGAWPRLGSR